MFRGSKTGREFEIKTFRMNPAQNTIGRTARPLSFQFVTASRLRDGFPQMQWIVFEPVQQIFLIRDVIAQGRQQLLSLKDEIPGGGGGREFHFPAELIVGAIELEMFFFQAIAVGWFRETEEWRLQVIFFLVAVLPDFDDPSFHGLELAETVA